MLSYQIPCLQGLPLFLEATTTLTKTMTHFFRNILICLINYTGYRKNRFIVMCGEPFQAWEMWLSPHAEKPVGSEVGWQDPRPWIGSPVGNQACIVPRLL